MRAEGEFLGGCSPRGSAKGKSRTGCSGGRGPIRILLAEDHAMVRQMLRLLLEGASDFEVVGEAENGFEAVGEAVKLEPDIVLMDMVMPGLDGLEATRRIKRSVPRVRILILTGYPSEQADLQALRAGALGCLNKTAVTAELERALRDVHEGHPYISAERIGAGIDPLGPGVPCAEQKGILTARENEVLKCIGDGHTNRQIAKALFMSVKTVETHKLNIMNKLSLRGSSDLMRYATIHAMACRDTEEQS